MILGSALTRWVFPSFAHNTAMIHLAGGFNGEGKSQFLAVFTRWTSIGVTYCLPKKANVWWHLEEDWGRPQERNCIKPSVSSRFSDTVLQTLQHAFCVNFESFLGGLERTKDRSWNYHSRKQTKRPQWFISAVCCGISLKTPSRIQRGRMSSWGLPLTRESIWYCPTIEGADHVVGR